MSERVPVAIRIPADQLQRIDQAATAHRLSRTDYLILSAIGELPNTTVDAIKRLDALETAVKRLEELAYALA